MDGHIDFEQIFKTYYTQLYCFARQIINDEQECHDIVSETYEDVWRNIASIRKETAKAYLYTCVRNKSINRLRHNNTHRQYIEYCKKMTAPYTNSDDLNERLEKERLINEVVETMQPPIGDVLRACFIDRKKYYEIAKEMGISLSLVKKYMTKAIAIIRENIQKKT